MAFEDRLGERATQPVPRAVEVRGVTIGRRVAVRRQVQQVRVVDVAQHPVPEQARELEGVLGSQRGAVVEPGQVGGPDRAPVRVVLGGQLLPLGRAEGGVRRERAHEGVRARSVLGGLHPAGQIVGPGRLDGFRAAGLLHRRARRRHWVEGSLRGGGPGQRRGLVRSHRVPPLVGMVVGGGRARRAGRGERAPVDLSGRGQRQLGDVDEGVRDHVLGQPFGQAGAQVRWAARPRAHAVRPQLAVVPCLAGDKDDGGLADPRLAAQHVLDLLQLHPEAADLHLVVGPAEKLDLPVGAEPAQASGGVHPAAGHWAERVGHELVRGAARVVEVAPGQRQPADEELADRAERHRVVLGVQDPELSVRVRPPDRHAGGGLVRVEHPAGDADRRLGGPVAVVKPGPPPLPEAPVGLVAQDLAPAPDVPQRTPRLHRVRTLEHRPERGRRDIAERHRMGADDLEQRARIRLGPRRRDHHERPGDQRQEDFVDRDVDAQRRFVQDDVITGEAQQVDLPAQPVADRLMTDHHALGCPGRPGGVDDVGEVLQVHGGVRVRVVGRDRPGGRAATGGDEPAGGVQPQQRHEAGAGRQLGRGAGRPGHHRRDPGFVGHRADAPGRPGAVQGDERAAGSQHTEQGHHLGGRA